MQLLWAKGDTSKYIYYTSITSPCPSLRSLPNSAYTAGASQLEVSHTIITVASPSLPPNTNDPIKRACLLALLAIPLPICLILFLQDAFASALSLQVYAA